MCNLNEANKEATLELYLRIKMLHLSSDECNCALSSGHLTNKKVMID